MLMKFTRAYSSSCLQTVLHIAPGILAQFTPEMCVAAQSREKFSKNSLLWRFEIIQGHKCWHP